MFICPEIEKVTDSTVSLLNRQVAYKDNDTNATFIEGNLIDKQSDDGKFYQFKSGYVGRDNSEPEWYAANTSLQFFGGSFQPIAYGTSKTIAEFAALIGVDITKNFTNTDSFYWTSRKLLEMISDYFFIVYSPGGLQFVIPKATGTDRGTVNKSDCIIRVKSSAVYNYAGESTGDIFIAANGEIQPVSITDAYKQMAVNKANAAANYMVFGSLYAYKCGDYVRSWDGVVYVILSGRRDNQTGLYEYTAVKEFVDSGAFAGADASPVVPVMAAPGEFDFATSIYERTLNGDGDVVSTTGSWQDVPINTETKDEIGGSVSSPNITLPAGKYRLEWMVPFYQGAGLTTRLYNTTSGAEIARGSNGYATTGQEGFSSGVTVVTLTVSTQIKLQCWTQSGTTLGVRGSSSLPTPNRYSRVTIIKLPA